MNGTPDALWIPRAPHSAERVNCYTGGFIQIPQQVIKPGAALRERRQATRCHEGQQGGMGQRGTREEGSNKHRDTTLQREHF